MSTRLQLCILTLLSSLGLFLYLNWEVVDQNVHQSTMIEINESGQVLVRQPYEIPQIPESDFKKIASQSSLQNPVDSTVNEYNQKNKNLIQELDTILKEENTETISQ